MIVQKYLMGWCKEDRDRLFSVVPSDRIGGNGHKLKYRRIHLNVREKLSTGSVIEHWNSLSRQAVEFSSLEIFKI